jgi:hypothetical protein
MSSPSDFSRVALARAAAFWFIIAAIGQAIFVAYMAGFYGPTLASGDFVQWTREKNLIDGYKPGDTVGNLGFISHIGVAFIVTSLGIAQLIPALRQRAPSVHRWCGRLFILAALAAAIGGLALVWLRGTQSSVSNSIAISLNGALIIAGAILAWRAALRRDFASHQRWAFRLWLVVNGVWFLRVGMAAFGMISIGALQLKDAPIGAFFAFWGFGSYLVPLAIYEIYWRAKTKGGPAARIAMTAALGLITLLMAGGVAGMTIGQWLPMILAPPL